VSTIDNLHKSISEMSDDELLQLLQNVRASRRVPKKTSKTQNATIKKSAPSTKAMKDLPAAALATLLKELEGDME